VDTLNAPPDLTVEEQLAATVVDTVVAAVEARMAVDMDSKRHLSPPTQYVVG